MEYITIGKVANAHGIRGDLKIFPTTDDIERFSSLKTLIVEHKGKQLNLTVENVRYHKNLVIISTSEINDMNEALAYKNDSIVVPMSEAVPLGENENFVFQLIGLMAKEEDGTELGKVKQVMHTGAHDVYVIDDGSKNGLMIPATLDFVPEVNVEDGYLIVKLIKGLRDL